MTLFYSTKENSSLLLLVSKTTLRHYSTLRENLAFHEMNPKQLSSENQCEMGKERKGGEKEISI